MAGEDHPSRSLRHARESLATPAIVRMECKRGQLTGPTRALAPGYAQANFYAIPEEHAEAFLHFCMSNPRSCPLLSHGQAGQVHLKGLCRGEGDVRTDLPRYRVVHNDGSVAEVESAKGTWGEARFVPFALGCSFTFESALNEVLGSSDDAANVPMYTTNIELESAGIFGGTYMVVSMRVVPASLTERVRRLTRSFPLAHGEPIHEGNPWIIGISDVSKPDFGSPPPEHLTRRRDYTWLFFPCGVTPFNALMASQCRPFISHSPGHMLVTDVPRDCQHLPATIPASSREVTEAICSTSTRGMVELSAHMSDEELVEAAHLIVRHGDTSRVVIFTGFNVPVGGGDAALETDGPPGAVILARCLRSLGCKVRLHSSPPPLPACSPFASSRV